MGGIESDIYVSKRQSAGSVAAGALSRREFFRAVTTSLVVWQVEPFLSTLLGNRTLLAESAELLRETVTVDLHCHVNSIGGSHFPQVDPNLQANMKTGGLDAGVFAVRGDYPLIKRDAAGRRYESRKARPGEMLGRSTEQLDSILNAVKEGRLSLARSPAEIVEAKKTGVPCLIAASEGSDPLEGDLTRVKFFYERGVRVLQLMHYRINEIGDIQTAPPQHNGLTAFGREVVREMNQLDMVIDTAHSSPDTLAGVLAESRVPVIFSHTGAYALRPLSRHLRDKEMHAIAAKGGIVGIWPNLRRRDRFETFLKDIDYSQKLIGADHVGIGTDLFGLDNTAIPTHKEFALIPAALLKRGYSDSVVGKIVGENFMRLFRAVASP